MGAKSDYLENKLIDFIFRGQAFTAPTTIHVGLLTAAPSDAGGGTEVTGGSYARVAVTSSLANWAGTQSAGSTTASSGTSGTTSNNGAITFPAPTANWGTVTHFGLYDAASSGNLLYWAALTTPKTINNGDAAPSFAAGALTVQEDN
ncbi:MAG: phage tail fiber protein [Aeromonas veronii]